MKRFTPAIAAAALTALAGTATAQTVTMRISHPVPTAHHLHKALEGFKAEVEKSSGGEIQVQLFPAEQAFKAGENHPAVARGAFEAACSTNFQWGNTIPEMNVMTIPYLFTNLEKLKRFPGSDAAKLLEKKLEEKRVRNFAWFYITRLSIFTSKKAPLIQVADFKGVKIRGLSSLSDTGLATIGAAPTPMAAPEMYQALDSGVLDAGLTDVSAAVSRKFYEVQKYGTVAPYFSVYYHCYSNQGWWSKLSPKHQQVLSAASSKAEQDIVPLTEETAAAATGQLREKGMVVHEQTPAEIAAWTAAMQKPVIDAFIKAAPDDGAKLIDLMGKL